LVHLHILSSRSNRLRIQAKVEEHFLRRGGHSAEVGVCRQGRRVVYDNLTRLLGLGILFGSSALLMKPVSLRWGICENSLEKQSDRDAQDAGSSKVRKNRKSEPISIVKPEPPEAT
jgi:hypothetical protein